MSYPASLRRWQMLLQQIICSTEQHRNQFYSLLWVTPLSKAWEINIAIFYPLYDIKIKCKGCLWEKGRIKEFMESPVRKMAKSSGMARHHRAWVCLLAQAPRCQRWAVSNLAKISGALSPLLSQPPATWLCLPVQGMSGTFQPWNLSVWTNRCNLGRMSFSWL